MRSILAVAFCLASTVALAQTPPPAGDPPIPADTAIQTTASGLKYSVLVAGTPGTQPKTGDRARVHYTGWTLDGKVFDSSVKRGAPFDVTIGSGVILGWSEGVALMDVGSKYKFTIPPALAYGAAGRPPLIPANATLVFEIELLDVPIRLPVFTAPVAANQKVTPSGLKYEVLVEGAGEPPTSTDMVELHYACFNTEAKLVMCHQTAKPGMPGTPIKATRDQLKPNLAFLDEGLALMKPGSHYRFEVPPALAFGAKQAGPDLPPNSVSIWDIKVTRVIKPLPMPAFAMPADSALKTTASGLKYEIIKAGTGDAHPSHGKSVTVNYAGWLTDGTLFDASFKRGEPWTTTVGQVIPGWNEGLALMTPGAIYKFVIPPDLAYGPEGKPPTIPKAATLIFYVELISFS